MRQKQAPQLPPPSPPHHNEVWFVLGRESRISAAEIAAYLNLDIQDLPIEGKILRQKLMTLDPTIINSLGGTVKIGTRLYPETLIKTEEDLIKTIIQYFRDEPGRKKDFGLSLYYEDDVHYSSHDGLGKLGKKIKKILTEDGIPARYIFDSEAELSSVSVKKNNLLDKGVEFLILKKNNNEYLLAKTIAVQPFEKFSERDFDRPGRDDFSGMLPPKLAMMMINLARANKNSTLLDPFCGSGTVLSEALLLGFSNVVGTDLYDKAITDTEKNVQWLKEKNPAISNFSTRVFQADVRDLDHKINHRSVGAIVTEPYLGLAWRGKIDRAKLDTQIIELKELYLSAFRTFTKILAPGAPVVFLVPRFWVNNKWVTIDIKKPILKMGFATESLLNNEDFLLYHRPGQQVAREIWRFRY
ncbi:MAG TPA: DNA methyltransferase [Patescibacteria group bacterium]|nr:DNA methyltransferase [Patescibacteria group bacterium]